MHDGTPMSMTELRKRLVALKQEHHDLDTAIESLTSQGTYNQLQVQRMKKRKLHLKDQIRYLEDQIIPDIIA